MSPRPKLALTLVLLSLSSPAIGQSPDADYARQIREYTSDPKFLAATVATLPDHPTVPSPRKHFGTIIGAPGVMHRVADIYKYYRRLAETTPRVRVERVGTTEEGKGAAAGDGGRRVPARRSAASPGRRGAARGSAHRRRASRPRASSAPSSLPTISPAASIRRRWAPRDADGARVSPGGERRAEHRGDPRERHHPGESRRRARRARPAGGLVLPLHQGKEGVGRRVPARHAVLGQIHLPRQQPRRNPDLGRR